MAITLTSPVPVPNITRIVLDETPDFKTNHTVMIFAVKSTPGNNREIKVKVVARNGTGAKNFNSDVIKLAVSPTTFDGDVVVEAQALNIATASDQLEAAYRSGANRNAAMRAVEQKCLDLNIIQLAGTVS